MLFVAAKTKAIFYKHTQKKTRTKLLIFSHSPIIHIIRHKFFHKGISHKIKTTRSSLRRFLCETIEGFRKFLFESLLLAEIVNFIGGPILYTVILWAITDHAEIVVVHWVVIGCVQRTVVSATIWKSVW